MTALQVIDEIKAMDPRERAKVLDLLRELEPTGKGASSEEASFDQVADRVLDRHAELMRKLAK